MGVVDNHFVVLVLVNEGQVHDGLHLILLGQPPVNFGMEEIVPVGPHGVIFVEAKMDCDKHPVQIFYQDNVVATTRSLGWMRLSLSQMGGCLRLGVGVFGFCGL